MPQWYELNVCRAHNGTCTFYDTTAYVFAANVCEVLNRYRRMPGLKKKKLKKIAPLSEKESLELEKRIADEGPISLSKAKRTWYYLNLAEQN